MALHIDILTPQGAVFSAEADEVTVPGELGELGILPGHIPIIAALDVGELVVRRGSHADSFAVEGGFVEIARDRMGIITERAMRPEQIDLKELADARAAAQREMREAEAHGPAAVAKITHAIRRCDVLESIARRSR